MRVVALVLGAATAVCCVLGAVWAAMAGLSLAAFVEGFGATSLTIALSCAAMGALLGVRRPDSPSGWLLLAIAVSAGTTLAAQQWVVLAASDGGYTGIDHAIGWWGAWAYQPVWALMVLLLLTVPDGRLGGRWRRLVALVSVAATVVVTLESALATSPRNPGLPSGFDNPLAWPAVAEVLTPLVDTAMTVAIVCILGGVVSLLAKFRGGDATTRLQLAWVLAGTVAAFAILFATGDTAVSPVTNGIAISLLPVTIAVAVLRYRLYDIGQLVSRTVAYTIVIAVLGAVYAVAVLTIGTLARLATGDGSGDAVIAASTLVVAAVFHPVRRRVKAAVDRRFHRSRVDAARMVDAFGHRLRDEVDLQQLVRELEVVAGRAVQPRCTSVWVRPSA